MSKIQEAAIKAKADGYEYMTSVVKQQFATTYHHVLSIDTVIEHGWIAAPINTFRWTGRVGIAHVPDKSINKRIAIAKYCK